MGIIQLKTIARLPDMRRYNGVAESVQIQDLHIKADAMKASAIESGDDLLSRAVSSQVPSAC